MSKKYAIPMIAVVLVTLFAGFWFSTNALAEDGQPGKPNNLLSRLRQANAVLGQVTEVGSSQFTIQTRRGEEKTFAVDENTRYRSKDQAEVSFSDLKAGAWVAVAAPRPRNAGADAPAAQVARFVALLPDDFDPAKLPDRHAGEIVAVDEAAGTLTLKTIKGNEELTFAVDESTRFKSKGGAGGSGGAIQGLDDLQTGQYGLVVSKAAETGSDPLAVLVAAGEKGDLQKFVQNRRDNQNNGQQGRQGQIADKVRAALAKYDQRLGGKVTAVTASSFTIEARDGKQYTLTVDSQTIFRSRGDQITGLQDIEVGMLVLVGADQASGGQLQAGLVLAQAPKQ